MKLVTRRTWGAKTPRGTYTRLARTEGVKIHYTGGNVPLAVVDDHEICAKLVRQIQTMHMAGGREQPYMDIGYNLAVCVHRRVFVGRDAHALPAANGAGLNTAHYAVLALIGSTGLTDPTDNLLHGLRDAIDYLRAEGNAGKQIRGHRDGYSTSCPGEPLYAWIKKGAPRPGAAPEPKPEPGLDPAKLPALAPGDTSPHVVTLRKLLHAADTTSPVYDPTDADLVALVEAFKSAKKLGSGPEWTRTCWKAVL